MVLQNPWEISRHRHIYIHPDDEHLVKQHNCKPRLKPELIIQRSLPPAPYMGNPRTARVLLLLKNPGYSPVDETEVADNPQLYDENVKALTFESDSPLFYLDPRFAGTTGYIWWDSVLGELLNTAAERCGVDQSEISGRIACLQSHSYRSQDSFDPKEPFPTQAWTDFLANEAAARPGVVFVMLGGEKRWIDAVPGLKSAEIIRVRNVRKPVLTSRNLLPQDFERLVSVLAAE